ncbi:MAG: DUF2807 domain-containing protein [Emcibacteraceae bacterium]|nr:DUF2807 domain-containing protein [Emcibacteraceae bacterium]MDG1995218.1 DUF2807 domain-containing protein [Emcibacteraceae bacterium]
MTKRFSNLNLSITLMMVSFLALTNTGYADEKTIEFDLTDFNEIRIDEVGLELDVTVGEDFKVEVIGEDELLDHLLMRVRRGKLVIYKDGGKSIWDHSGNSSPHVIISMPEFNGLELRGAIDADIKGVDSDEVEFDIKGAGHIVIEGKCNWLNIDFKGAGNIEADKLKCKKVDVDLKGAGNIEVYASEKVDADIKGMGNIEVYGNPEDVTTDGGWFSNISIH